MIQQIIALGFILVFIFRLIYQKKKEQISIGEFFVWLFFWFAAALSILFIKSIDKFVGSLGFSASGIDMLLYLAVLFLLYTIFRLHVKLEKQDRIITKIVREISFLNKK